ncbi:MAG TPA: 6,7-dimethyl-8-ribityllumazine synthase [Bacteroidota bacterium]|nr:6,7-dimethyl-8-ribityllumazine synthase [Bacteroidota bacterium]
MQIIEGTLSARGRTWGIVVSRFNSLVTEQLLSGATDCLIRHGASESDITVVRTPGAFEIPPIALRLATSGTYNAVICLGCVIRGDTPHFDYIASQVSKGIAQIALQTNTPVSFGVLTTDTLEQALERAGAKAGNKGWDAALSAIELADLSSRLSDTKKGSSK